MAVLLVPKVLAYFVMLTRPADRQGSGGALRALASLLLETVISGLVAPVMMMFQSRAMVQILAGHDAGWQVQRRDDGSLPWKELLHQYSWHTATGVVLGASAFAVSPSLFLWMTPVIVGLLFAIPTVVITSHAALGVALRRMGLFLIPEEHQPPAILERANVLVSESARAENIPAFSRLQRDPALLAAHVAMTRPAPRVRGEVDVDLVVARAKLADAAGMDDALAFLSRREIFAVLADRDALHVALANGPGADRPA
jgi:membrane glycosyltransferase